jgi:hypothetical protein
VIQTNSLNCPSIMTSISMQSHPPHYLRAMSNSTPSALSASAKMQPRESMSKEPFHSNMFCELPLPVGQDYQIPTEQERFASLSQLPISSTEEDAGSSARQGPRPGDGGPVDASRLPRLWKSRVSAEWSYSTADCRGQRYVFHALI